ncbi:MAG: SH3 domain-containing protein [Chloroflexi bacterium]|nr:SH3 domain-containing protein [Chloroflexota bacterium]
MTRFLLLFILGLLLISCQGNIYIDSSGQLQIAQQVTPVTQAAVGAVDPGGVVSTTTGAVEAPETSAETATLTKTEPVASPTLIPSETPTPTLAPTSTPTSTPLPYAQAAAISPTNLRKGPGTNYNKVGLLQKGEELEIIGKNGSGSWWQLQNDKGQPVWIIASQVQVEGPAENIAVAENIPEPPQPKPQPQAIAGGAPADSAPADSAPAGGAPAGGAPAGGAPAGGAPAGAGQFGYGLQIQPYYGADIGLAAHQIRDLGFNWVKWQVVWRDMERGPGQVDWGEQDRLIGFFGDQGLQILASIVKAPEWARAATTDLGVEGPPADAQTFANFLGAYAGRYCGRVQAIEVWNEQNLHYEWGNEPLDPVRYMDMLKRSYQAIKQACPQMIVVSGALTPVGEFGALAIDDFRYLEMMYQNGLKNYSDAIGAHPSGYNVPPNLTWQQACDYITSKNTQFNGPCDTPHHSWSARSTMEGYRNIMAVYGDANKRIWPTEFGWAAGGAFDANYMYANDNSYDEQARWTVDFYQMMRNWGFVGPAFLWNLNFSMINAGTELAQWSIVDEQGNARQTFNALKQMGK